jgi:heme-degrading monooxygenase HmoA
MASRCSVVRPTQETRMSVFMMLQVEGDAERVAQIMQDPQRWESVNDRAKELGAIHHRFLVSADGKTVAVFDEWESAEGFQRFFESSPEIPQIMQDAGVTSEPRITFWHPVDTPDQF